MVIVGAWLLIGAIVTLASTLREGSALLAAEIIAVAGVLTVGALYRPVESIEPAEAVHVTAVLEVPVTDAVNCCLWPDARVTLAGEIDTLIKDMGGETTWIEKLWLPWFCSDASVAAISKEYVPAAVGVPETEPVIAFNVRPAGMVPDLTLKRYGALPPLTLITAL